MISKVANIHPCMVLLALWGAPLACLTLLAVPGCGAHAAPLTGTRDATNAAYMSLRYELKALAKSPIFVVFAHEGEVLLADGRIRQALQTFQQLAAGHPNSPKQHVRVARALLTARLGMAARDYVDGALERFPAAASLHQTKGWILEHDLMGQRHM